MLNIHCEKMSKYGVISSPYFPVFRLNTEIFGVNLRIQSEYRKTRTRNNSVFGHFSRSDMLKKSPNLSLYMLINVMLIKNKHVHQTVLWLFLGFTLLLSTVHIN